MNYLLQKLRINSELNFDWIQRVKKTLLIVLTNLKT